MVAIEPDIRPDALFEMGQAAKLLGISPSTLHRYTQQGLIPCKVRKVNGRRVWKGKDLILIWRIVY